MTALLFLAGMLALTPACESEAAEPLLTTAGPSKAEPAAWSLTAENDSMATGADRNYTSGIELSYVAPLDDVPAWASTAERVLLETTGARPSMWGIAVGQSIFTPDDIAANPAPPDQHPYAGFLYLQLMAAAEEAMDNDPRASFMDIVELEIGLVGPSSLGQQSQQGVHELLNAPNPAGWDSQLKDELAFALSFDRRWRAAPRDDLSPPGGLETDLTPSVGFTVGTLRTEAYAGLSARLGYGLADDYGAPRVRPSLSGAGYFRPQNGFSWYVFGGVQVRAVARNLFLDGNTFRDSASVDKHTFVADAQLGAALQMGDWRLIYTYVTRSEEFKTQGERQDFGALSLSVRY